MIVLLIIVKQQLLVWEEENVFEIEFIHGSMMSVRRRKRRKCFEYTNWDFRERPSNRIKLSESTFDDCRDPSIVCLRLNEL